MIKSFIYLIVIGWFFIGCTRSVGPKSTLKFNLPKATSPAPSAKSSGDVSASNVTSSWGLSDPTELTQISCYVVAVEGPEEAMRSQSCTKLDGEVVMNPGVILGAFPAGSQITVDVPTGPQRKVALIGLAASPGTTCVDFANVEIPKTQLSAPHILGTATLDLEPGIVETDIVASMQGAIKFEDCTGLGIPSGANPNQPPTMTVGSVSGSIGVGSSTQITVDGGTPPFTFEVIGGNGSIDSGGLFTAPATPELATIKVTDGLGVEATTQITVVGVPTKLALISFGTQMLGGCHQFDVELQDAGNNPTSQISPTTINLTGASNGAFFSDPTCTTGASSAFIPSSLTKTSFFYKNTVSETPTLVVTDNAAILTADNLAVPITVPNITVNDVGVIEGGAAIFTITTNLVSTADINVDFTTTDNIASAPGDYVTSSGTATILAGNLSTTVTVATADDALHELTEDFTLNLSNPVFATIADASGTATVTDNDSAPTIQFALASSSALENVTPNNIGLLINATSSVNATVDFTVSGTATGGGVDFTLANGTATITAGLTTTNIVLPIVDDALFEAAETVVLTLSNPGNSVLGGTVVHTFTINENDPAPAVLAISETDPFDYGSITVAATVNHSFIISNSGGQPATGLGESGLAAPYQFLGGGFPGTGGDCGGTLGGGANCTIVIEYAPTAAVVSNDTIIIDYNDGYGAQTATRDITGTGITPAVITISETDPFDYGNIAVGAIFDHTFTVTNGGGSQATAMNGSGLAAPFSFKGGAYPGTGGTCAATLNASFNCTVVVTYAPTTTILTNETFDINYNDGAAPQTSSRDVRGTGVAPALLTITETDPYDYGAVVNGGSLDHTFTLNNAGGFAATGMVGNGLLAPFSFKGGAYPGTGGTCTATLGASGSCTVIVTFAPTANVVSNDTINIDYNDGVVAQSTTRDVTGTGVTPIGTWTATSTTGAPTARKLHTAVWTGIEMLIWGGNDGASVNSGGRYDPVADNWGTAPTATGAPTGREEHSAVWTGSRMIVWGGFDGATHFADGGIYDPVGDTWTNTTNDNTFHRRAHTAVWTGSKMIVFGGKNPTVTANPRIYDPVGDAWSGTAAGSPTAREAHAAVWTGSEMLIWGGVNGGAPFGDGKRYNPDTDTWATITNAGAPAGRRDFAYAWTGTKFIVWGGLGNGATRLNDGGIYDPDSNSWTAITTIGAPTARNFVKGVWTGTHFLVYGGIDSGGKPNDGGAYDPVTNTWIPLTTTGAPAGRIRYSMIWDGFKSIVWGGEDSGSFNDGGRLEPQTASPNIKKIVSGRKHNCTLYADGDVKCWGDGGLGQLGYENIATVGDAPAEMGTNLAFVNLGTGLKAIDIEAGGNTTCAILKDRTLKCWGENDQGQLGLGDTVDRGDNAGEMGDNLPTISLVDKVRQVVVGNKHTCAILVDDTTWCWGDNQFGQLGDNNAPTDSTTPVQVLGTGGTGNLLEVQKLAAGYDHVCAIMKDSLLNCWGKNAGGQIGDGSTIDKAVPTAVIGGIGDVQLISAGKNHTCASSFDRTQCWGGNADGQLGDNTTTNSNSPVITSGGVSTIYSLSLGDGFSCARINASAKCWGRANLGQLGSESGTNLLLPTAVVSISADLRQISTGEGHACALYHNNDVKCWGQNINGQLGLGNTTGKGLGGGDMAGLPAVDLAP